MGDAPAQTVPPVLPLFIHTGMCPPASRQGAFTASAITWVANHAVYMPMTIPWPYPVRRVFWVNGSTITTSNADFGIYTADGTRLYSTGSTALSGTSAPQYTDVTDFILPAGKYWFAYTCDNTTNRSFGSSTITAISQRLAGILQQGSALPLPSNMASAVAATQALLPLCGITRTASGF